ncbi:MAG: hypothetical protein HZA78_00240 [Candidatus Schekmanbacteria bacterium]|nr:hypothetical protein [Candidatus Schekmanbacteria bacterium]
MNKLENLFAGIIFAIIGFCCIFFNGWMSKSALDFQLKTESYLVKKIPFYKYIASTDRYPIIFLRIPFFGGGVVFLFVGGLMIYRFF